MVLQQITKLFITAMLMLVLSGCGFHLRGEGTVPPEMKVLYLEAPNPYDRFIVELRDNLDGMGVHLVPSPGIAPVTLQILNATFSKDLTTVSSNTLVRTYTLRFVVVFQLTDVKGRGIYGPITVATTANYTTNDNQLLGDTQTLETERYQMQREIIFKLFNRINSIEGRKALRKHIRGTR